jgi:putative DNA primase/helicase
MAMLPDPLPPGMTDLGDEADREQARRRPSATPSNGHDHDASAVIKYSRGGDFVMEKVRWVWPGWLALGEFHMLGGTKGDGKSTIGFDLLAQMTYGGKFPDGSSAPCGDVVIWSGEDSITRTILPRMVVAGADRDRIVFISSVTTNGIERSFDPATDMAALLQSSRQLPNLVAMMIDPVVSAMPGDSHKNAETRRGLQPLVDFAASRDITMVGVTHFTKGTQGSNPIERITGSLAFGAMPRVVMATAKGETEDSPRRLVRIASNIGPTGGGYEYLLRQDLLPELDFTAQRVGWGKYLEGSPLELLENGENRKTKQKQAAELLNTLLTAGPVAVTEIKEAASANGISWRTIEAVKNTMPAIVARKAGRSWEWEKQAVATPHWAAQ